MLEQVVGRVSMERRGMCETLYSVEDMTDILRVDRSSNLGTMSQSLPADFLFQACYPWTAGRKIGWIALVAR